MIKIQATDLDNIAQNHFNKLKSLVRLELFNKKEKKYIEQNLERIILAKELEFSEIIEETKNFNTQKMKLAFIGSQRDKKHKVGASNGYNKFTNKSTTPYNAYDLAEALNVNTCPYCNRNYTHTVKSITNKSTRPEFDHFICKTKHPIFALSFYNLIPSCSICNSSIKGQAKFYYETHIHPYFDDFNSIKKFTIDKTLLSLVNKNDNFNIIFENRDNISLADENKANKHIEDFVLETLYNSHKDKVLELVDLSRAYNEDSLQSIVDTFHETKIFKDSNDLKRLLLCHHVDNKDIDKRPLNKLVKDISEELGLL